MKKFLMFLAIAACTLSLQSCFCCRTYVPVRPYAYHAIHTSPYYRPTPPPPPPPPVHRRW